MWPMSENAETNSNVSEPGWTSTAGNAWVGVQDLTDRIYEPVERLLTDEVELLLTEEAERGRVSRVLDVGCGTGASTVAIARRLGPAAEVAGIDISEPMVEAARRRAGKTGVEVRFELANAQTRRFAEGAFDLVVSRWGLMFFGDPVAAFSNLGRAAKGGGFRAIVWRSHTENPFMTVAEEAAAPLLPGFEPRRGDESPGQFALADQRATSRLLEAAGWQQVELRPVDLTCSLPETELVRYFTGLGPLARHLDELPPNEIPENLVETVRDAFSPYVERGEVSFNAACWMIEAR